MRNHVGRAPKGAIGLQVVSSAGPRFVNFETNAARHRTRLEKYYAPTFLYRRFSLRGECKRVGPAYCSHRERAVVGLKYGIGFTYFRVKARYCVWKEEPSLLPMGGATYL